MQLMPRVRMTLARRPWIYWCAVAAAASVTATMIVTAMAGVSAERESWGTTRAVLVADSAIVPGSPINASTAHLRELPLAMIPDAALRAMPDAATARQHVTTGEVLVTDDIVARSGPAALLPDGWLAVGIDATGPAAFAVGDAVAVLADGRIVAADGLVIGVSSRIATGGDDGLVVAVPAEQAAEVARFAAERTAVVALAG